MEFTLKQIGAVHCGEGCYFIELLPEYKSALQGLDGFSYVQVIWWFDGCDNSVSRNRLTLTRPYKKGLETLGVFATRSPERPNPIAVSPSYVTYLDPENGIIGLAWIDANEGSPVLDIKPYTPSVDRVESPTVPEWCANWPKNVETSGDFDWSEEFNF